jgi:hypothetical protein
MAAILPPCTEFTTVFVESMSISPATKISGTLVVPFSRLVMKLFLSNPIPYITLEKSSGC